MRFKAPIISLSIFAAILIYYAWKHPSPVKEFMTPQIQRLHNRVETLELRENDATAIRMALGEEAVDILLPILVDQSEPIELRCTVAYELKQLKDARVKNVFEKMKQQSKDMERCGNDLEISASRDPVKARNSLVLEKLQGAQHSMESLFALLKDQYPEVRQAACEALGNTHSVHAIKPLAATLNDKNKNVRHAAARGLIKIRHPDVVREFVFVLKDENSPAGDLAHLALLELTGTGIPKDFTMWMEWFQQNEQVLNFFLEVNSKNAFSN